MRSPVAAFRDVSQACESPARLLSLQFLPGKNYAAHLCHPKVCNWHGAHDAYRAALGTAPGGPACFWRTDLRDPLRLVYGIYLPRQPAHRSFREWLSPASRLPAEDLVLCRL